jgi:hypothetical protein
VFADVMNLITPAHADPVDIAPGLLLTFAVLLEIPIAMVFLARFLPRPANRRTNLAACAITIVFTIAGGTLNLHYAFFATAEIVCMLLIAHMSWRWPVAAPAELSATPPGLSPPRPGSAAR